MLLHKTYKLYQITQGHPHKWTLSIDVTIYKDSPLHSNTKETKECEEPGSISTFPLTLQIFIITLTTDGETSASF